MQHNNTFSRFESLVGLEKFNEIKNKKILVVGVGGVGGYVVESLARCGIENITIVDYDVIDFSNINRQIIALNSTIGLNKVDVLEDRIHDININCKVTKYKMFLDDDTKDKILNNSYDYIIDCCDDVNAKKLLIKYCVDNNIKIVSSMGTANKLDPTKLEIVDLRKTINDPLARIMRKFIKEEKINKKIMVLSSKEVPKKNNSILASNSFVPPSAGLLISSYIINEIING